MLKWNFWLWHQRNQQEQNRQHVLNISKIGARSHREGVLRGFPKTKIVSFNPVPNHLKEVEQISSSLTYINH